MTDTITVDTLNKLSELHTGARKNAGCLWEVYDGGHVAEGVLRAFTDARGNFLNYTDNVMDAYVWISSAVEHFIPVRDVLAKMQTGMFGIR